MGKIIDLTGQTFGKLTVLYRDTSKEITSGKHARWICQCECGKIISVQSNHLRAGDTTACSFACKNRIPNGTRFGKLVILDITDERVKNSGEVLYKCKCDCGNIELISSTELRSLRKTFCSKCHKNSSGEILITNLLTENNIQFFTEYAAPGCINNETNAPLRFDFYLPDYNTMIEYDGEQHFIPVKMWGGEEGLIKRQQLDNIKNNFCKKNNINLIRIPYTQLKNLEFKDLMPSTSMFLYSFN